MQIPAQSAATADAALVRRDAAPVPASAAVAGVAEEAQKLDPRVALRWTQPVLKADAAQLMRDSAAAALAPAGAAAYPQLSALATLLGPWMAKAEERLAEGTPPYWPEPDAEDGPSLAPNLPPRTAVHQALDRLMSALSRSDAFAASRLAQSWWLQPDDPSASATTDAQQARWVAALAPGSEGAQQAARLLLTGQVLWEGALLPDLPVRIQRKDAWRGGDGPDRPLQKGAALELQVDLPGLGPLRVFGQQWGASLQLQLQLPQGQEARMRQRWDDLQTRLQRLGVAGLQLQELAPASTANAKEAGHG